MDFLWRRNSTYRGIKASGSAAQSGDGGLVTKSCLTLVTPWTVAHQAPLSMGFSREEYWSVLPFPPQRNLANPGIKPRSLASLALQTDSLLLSRYDMLSMVKYGWLVGFPGQAVKMRREVELPQISASHEFLVRIFFFFSILQVKQRHERNSSKSLRRCNIAGGQISKGEALREPFVTPVCITQCCTLGMTQ